MLAKDRANATGSTKVTAKHVAGAMIKKAVRKVAPVMFEVINEVVSDPAFNQLSQANREKLEASFKQITEAKNAEEQLAGLGESNEPGSVVPKDA